MNYWLETTGSIQKGVGFSQFDSTHAFWLVLFALFTLAVCQIYRRADGALRKKLRLGMAAAIVGDELFKMAVLFIGGNYTINYLPLHLCSINIFLVAYHAFRPNAVLDNFLYAFCIPGAVAALLFPGWTKLPLANFMHIHSFTLHIFLVVYPAMLLAGGDIKPDWRKLPKCLGVLACFAVLALIVNLIFGTNYMYLMKAPKGNPLRWFQDNWGSHLYGFLVLIPAVLAVMYVPVIFRREKKAQPSCNRLRKMLK